MSQFSPSSPDLSGEHQISLIAILRFLRCAWKTVAITGAVGMAVAIYYLAITPNRYEATSKITMAQVGAANGLNHLGVSIEEPSLLIMRLASPTSFNPDVVAACGLQDQVNGAMMLSNSIKLTVPKGVANTVELTTIGRTPQAAEGCNLAIFNLIKVSQSQIIQPYVEEAMARLIANEELLAKARDMAAKLSKSGASAAYFSSRDEIRYLLDENRTLRNIAQSSQNRAARLVAPIFVHNTPISPKKKATLTAGLFSGLLLGLLIALARRVMPKWQE